MLPVTEKQMFVILLVFAAVDLVMVFWRKK
jgi:hypothetical protein